MYSQVCICPHLGPRLGYTSLWSQVPSQPPVLGPFPASGPGPFWEEYSCPVTSPAGGGGVHQDRAHQPGLGPDWGTYGLNMEENAEWSEILKF